MRIRTAVSVLMFLGCILLHGVAHGQGRRTYEPSSPTVSPYLNLLRSNLGPLPNYHSLVRPQMRQQAFNRGATQVLDYNRRQINSIENSPVLQQRPIQVREAGIRPTGLVGRFQYFSHFYAQPQASGRSR